MGDGVRDIAGASKALGRKPGVCNCPIREGQVSYRVSTDYLEESCVLCGAFWFTGPEPELEVEGPWTGWFTLLGQAESPQSAEEKFHRLISRMKGRFEGFDSVLHVYAGDIIEVKELPARGVMAYFHEDPEPGAQHIYASLPGVSPEFCVSHGLGNEANTEIEPFMSFEE